MRRKGRASQLQGPVLVTAHKVTINRPNLVPSYPAPRRQPKCERRAGQPDVAGRAVSFPDADLVRPALKLTGAFETRPSSGVLHEPSPGCEVVGCHHGSGAYMRKYPTESLIPRLYGGFEGL